MMEEALTAFPARHSQSDDLDINCGTIVDGTATVSEVGDQIFDYLIEVASGKYPKSEELGYGVDEFKPWQFGIIS